MTRKHGGGDKRRYNGEEEIHGGNQDGIGQMFVTRKHEAK